MGWGEAGWGGVGRDGVGLGGVGWDGGGGWFIRSIWVLEKCPRRN